MEQSPQGQFAGIPDSLGLGHRRSHYPGAVGTMVSCRCWASFLEAGNLVGDQLPCVRHLNSFFKAPRASINIFPALEKGLTPGIPVSVSTPPQQEVPHRTP